MHINSHGSERLIVIGDYDYVGHLLADLYTVLVHRPSVDHNLLVTHIVILNGRDYDRLHTHGITRRDDEFFRSIFRDRNHEIITRRSGTPRLVESDLEILAARTSQRDCNHNIGRVAALGDHVRLDDDHSNANSVVVDQVDGCGVNAKITSGTTDNDGLSTFALSHEIVHGRDHQRRGSFRLTRCDLDRILTGYRVIHALGCRTRLRQRDGRCSGELTGQRSGNLDFRGHTAGFHEFGYA